METPSIEAPNQSVKQNSVKQYPSLPFLRQPQESSGLTSKQQAEAEILDLFLTT
jgi:hypothetical protein